MNPSLRLIVREISHPQRTCSVLASLVLIFGGARLHAAVTALHINPSQTDPAIETVHGPHLVLYDPQKMSRHRLLLFLVGTRGKAESSLNMDRAFASWGYHAISLDYEDNVIAVSCAHSLDSNCFGHYRKAIVTGAPVSDKIKVDPANSILNRFQKLLLYLVQHDPAGGWNEFVIDGQPAWSRILVAGHSQGAGHAAYIGKLFPVDRVLMFSGPQDYLDDLHRPAPWQAEESATRPSRFFSFLNLNDPFDVQHQIANCMVLMKLSKPETLMVKPDRTIHGDHHILVNDFPTRQPHGSTLLPQFKNVWKYMATASTE
ncbi:MAG TPA: hypothetical protein VHX20_11780 [Terracidiphilus sp.]|nr:hypothetical protein [Terracidiphilus sp.]